jgi:hypothetical protein
VRDAMPMSSVSSLKQNKSYMCGSTLGAPRISKVVGHLREVDLERNEQNRGSRFQCECVM